MRTVFVMSLVCALMSLLAIFGFSAMSIVPGHGTEGERTQMMIVAGAFAVAWLCLAFWVRSRQRAASRPLPPQRLRRLLVCASVVYLIGVLCVAFG
ncbi:MAG: hypothetical protein ABSG78_02395 [Verrucomicrobiota bacterium]|jgi:drug/metabolite transporter (DMT)-like permease